jgi:hypothetical protein
MSSSGNITADRARNILSEAGLDVGENFDVLWRGERDDGGARVYFCRFGNDWEPARYAVIALYKDGHTTVSTGEVIGKADQR